MNIIIIIAISIVVLSSICQGIISYKLWRNDQEIAILRQKLKDSRQRIVVLGKKRKRLLQKLAGSNQC